MSRRPGRRPAVRAVVVLKAATKGLTAEEAADIRARVYGPADHAAGLTAIMARSPCPSRLRPCCEL